MQTAVLEVRDRATCIPVLAIRMKANDPVCGYWMHGRCGYPRDGSTIVVMKLSDQAAHSDPYDWGGRTMTAAHDYITNNFDSLSDGDVVDVRVILGEAATPAASERLEANFPFSGSF